MNIKLILMLGMITLCINSSQVYSSENSTEITNDNVNSSVKFNFNNRTALVTGGTSGIGLATAKLLARSNCNVVIVGHDLKKADIAKEINKECSSGTTRCLYFHADVSKDEDAKKAVEFAVKEFGSLDYLVCSAGIGGDNNTIDKETPENFNKVISVDLYGTACFNKYATQQMLEQKKGGAIVNVSSMFGCVAVPDNVSYSMAKGAINNLTRAGVKYAENGIRVNCVCPGVIDTPLVPEDQKSFYANLHPMKRIGKPEEVAPLITFLLSDDAKFITGSIIPIDGGYTAI